MKPAAVTLGALAIAVVSGTGGFFLGKNQAAKPAAASFTTTPAGPAGKPPSPADRRPGVTKTNFASLPAELDREPDPLARFNLALKNLEAWINADPKAALAWLKSQQPTGRRAETIRMALGQFAENDPKGAAEWALANLTGVDLNNALIQISELWARRDGLEAASWLSALPATRERDAALENMFFAWAADNPAAAIDFIRKNPGSDALSATLRYAAFAGWAKTDPVNAAAASLESSRANRDAAQFANTLANWATMDLAGSSQWLLANVQGGEERALAIQELATIYAHQSPDAGLVWIGKLNAGAERDAAVNQLASEWATADPAAAAKWAASQTLGKLTADSVSEILHCFLAKDATAFEAWQAALPEGPLKKQAGEVGAAGEDE